MLCKSVKTVRTRAASPNLAEENHVLSPPTSEGPATASTAVGWGLKPHTHIASYFKIVCTVIRVVATSALPAKIIIHILDLTPVARGV